MTVRVGSLVRRHASRLRSEVRRLSRTGAIAWDEELLLGPTPPLGPIRTAFHDAGQAPVTRPYELVGRATHAGTEWSSLSPLARACVALEVLHRLVAIRESTTSGIGRWCGLDEEAATRFEGVEARRRAAMAIILALRAQHLRTRRRRFSARPLALDGVGLTQTTEVVPRGVSLVLLGEESPCWAPYPVAFANLVTGNTLLVSPSAKAVEPATVLVEVWRQVLVDHGLAADVVQLAVVPEFDLDYERELVSHYLIALIDDTIPGTGSLATLQTNAPHALVRQEPAGRHVVLLDSGQHHRNVLEGLEAAARAGAALRAKPLLVVVPPDGLVLESTRLTGAQVADEIGRLARTVDPGPGQERSWQVTMGAPGSPSLDQLDRLRSFPGVRALHLVSADPRLTRRASGWARSAGVFLLVENAFEGPIGDVRAQEASALLDDDFVAPRLRTHHARLRV